MPQLSPKERPTIGLILSGGGARAAYQVGVLSALADFLPARYGNPFPIICGTSAGAINAAALAADAHHFQRSARRLRRVWEQFNSAQIYHADWRGALANSARWFASTVVGPGGRNVALLNNQPLSALLERTIDFSAIDHQVEIGALKAFAVTCSAYYSGQSVTFFQGRPDLKPWQRARRVGVAMPIGVSHLMASSALPFIFPPVCIDEQYYGDGSMRQLAPLSPALHLGADRLLVIGVGQQFSATPPVSSAPPYPTLAQVAGHALDSIFLDGLEVDLERLQRINHTVGLIPAATAAEHQLRLKPVAYRVITPSEPLSTIAARHVQSLPVVIRGLLHTVGGLRRSGSSLVSYLLFEQSYCRELIALGYRDTQSRKDDLIAFLGLESD